MNQAWLRGGCTCVPEPTFRLQPQPLLHTQCKNGSEHSARGQGCNLSVASQGPQHDSGGAGLGPWVSTTKAPTYRPTCEGAEKWGWRKISHPHPQVSEWEKGQGCGKKAGAGQGKEMEEEELRKDLEGGGLKPRNRHRDKSVCPCAPSPPCFQLMASRFLPQR